MKISKGIFTGLLVLGLLCLSGIVAAQEDTSADNTTGLALTDDIQPYDGPIGADSPLFGLKIAMEDIDESFTSNQSERVDKQIGHARLRIAEVRRALELNESDSAQHALDLYWQKMNLTQNTIAPFKSNATGLFHAQEQIMKHQVVLEHLLLDHPNNTGLQRAYNNSFELEHKFEAKTEMRLNRTMENGNMTITREFGFDRKDLNSYGNQTGTHPQNVPFSRPTGPDQNNLNSHGNQTGSHQQNATFSRPMGPDQNNLNSHGNQTGTHPQNATFSHPSVVPAHGQQNGGENNLNKQTGTNTTITHRPTVSVTPSITPSHQQGQQPVKNPQNGNSGNTDNKGKGNSHNG